MRFARHPAAAIVLVLATTLCLGSTAGRPAQAAPAWVERSNKDAQALLRVLARFNPEGAGRIGMDGLDEQIIDLKPGYNQRSRKAVEEVLLPLQQRLQAEQDPMVRQDLQILIKAARDSIRGIDLQEKYEVPYFDLPQMVFGGMRALLDEQVAPQRRQAALVRLRRYVGAEAGYTPLSELARARTQERLGTKGLLMPVRQQVEKDLANSAFFSKGTLDLLARYHITGHEALYAQLKKQLADYEAFVRREVLPRARTDFRLPAEEYAYQMERVGVDIPPAELAQKARAAFSDIQRQMQVLAQKVARDRGLKASDYRAVIRELKKEQVVGPAILPHYEKRLAELEAIIRREGLVTLPQRPARIRLASEAESASIPAPTCDPRGSSATRASRVSSSCPCRSRPLRAARRRCSASTISPLPRPPGP